MLIEPIFPTFNQLLEDGMEHGVEYLYAYRDIIQTAIESVEELNNEVSIDETPWEFIKS